MKTNVIMQRPMGNFVVEQRTKDGFFNATGLLNQWNNANKEKQRSLDNFWKTTNLNEFMEEVTKDPENNLKSNTVEFTELKSLLSTSSKGRYGGTWMNKYLFVKFAMYLNPRFEYQVVKFVSDNLIEMRKESGNSYRKMCDALYPYFKKDEFEPFIKHQAFLIKQICKVENWEQASQAQLELRNEIENMVSLFAGIVPPPQLLNTAVSKLSSSNYLSNQRYEILVA